MTLMRKIVRGKKHINKISKINTGIGILVRG